MPHFLIQNEEINNEYIELLNNENLFHITKVLRAKVGEKIKFIDKKQNVYLCSIENITKNSLRAKILETKKTDRKNLSVYFSPINHAFTTLNFLVVLSYFNIEIAEPT